MLGRENDIKRYLDGELTESERLSFEEAMNKDDELALAVDIEKEMFSFFNSGELTLREEIQTLGQKHFLEPSELPQKTYKKWLFWVFPLLLFFIVGGYLFYTNNNASEAITPSTKNQKEAIQTPPIQTPKTNSAENPLEINTPIPEETPSTPLNINQDELTSSPKNQPIAAINPDLFVPNAYLDKVITDNVRSSDTNLTITTPKKEHIFKMEKGQEKQLFQLEGTINKSISVNLHIYNNAPERFTKDYPILKQQLTPVKDQDNTFVFSYKANLSLGQGLYYLIIKGEDELEVLHARRFYVR